MILLLLSLLACDSGTPEASDLGGDGDGVDTVPGDDGAAPAEPPPHAGDDFEVATGDAAAARADLRVKRWRQLTLDLEGALELPGDALCNEAGLYDCRELHVVPLGGVSVPNGLYNTVDSVGATTGLAMERFVMQACWNRAKADAEAIAEGEAPVVYKHLSDPLGTTADADELAAQVAELYRRLLARDPIEAELTALSGLHDTVVAEGGTTADWAILACFSVGTTTEALTY